MYLARPVAEEEVATRHLTSCRGGTREQFLLGAQQVVAIGRTDTASSPVGDQGGL